MSVNGNGGDAGARTHLDAAADALAGPFGDVVVAGGHITIAVFNDDHRCVVVLSFNGDR